jgi:hypothetical protein
MSASFPSRLKELRATGRDDIIREVEAGRLGLHAALKKAKPEKYAKPRDGLKAICRAWERASERERLDFLTALSQGDPLAPLYGTGNEQRASVPVAAL